MRLIKPAGRIASMTKPAGYGAFIILLFLVPIFIQDAYPLHILIMTGINIILACSLRTIIRSGQFSLAHAAFMAIGAYASALLTIKLGLSFWAALPVAGIAAMLLALLVGYPFVRVKRVYFGMLTLFLAEVIRLGIIEWRGLTGGSTGLNNIPIPNSLVIPGLINIDFTSKMANYYLALVLVLISLLVLFRIEVSRIGKTMCAIEQNDLLSQSTGVNITRFKILALCVGCFFAGIAGSLYAHYIQNLSPGSFTLASTVYIVVYIMAGGQRRFSGPIVGAFILTIIPEVSRVFKEYQPLVFVAVLYLIIMFLPEGVVTLPSRLREQIKRLRKG